MPDKDPTTTSKEAPPAGDSKKAEKYLTQIIDLVADDKVIINHTDLGQYDPSVIQDHYRMELKDYHVEISHSKQPNTGNDSFVMLFTNLNQVREGCSEKIILAYMHLDQAQFHKFKIVADQQLERERKRKEAERFDAAMADVDRVLAELSAGDNTVTAPEAPTPKEPTSEITNSAEAHEDGEAFADKFSQLFDGPAQTSYNDDKNTFQPAQTTN